MDNLSKQHQVVHVTFSATAYADTDILHTLTPSSPEFLDYVVLKTGQPCRIYHDASATRTAWTSGRILLRCDTAGAIADILLIIRDPDTTYTFWNQALVAASAPPGGWGWSGGSVPWASVDKTGSSLGDLAARAVANLSDASILARRNDANTFSGNQTISAGYDLNVDANTFVVNAALNAVGVMTTTPTSRFSFVEGVGGDGKVLDIWYGSSTYQPFTAGVTRTTKDA